MIKNSRMGHKKILALDGGGIKGALTLGLLKRLETILQERNGSDYKLYQYFDLIGGTSTGAIISAGLAIGMSVDEVKERYFEFGEAIFGKKSNWNFIFGGGGYKATRVKKYLKQVFGDIKLDDKSIKTGLAIFAKRIDTQSLWIMHNNPEHKYWKYQKDYLLREVVRASTAAPTYFKSEAIDVKGDGSQSGDFVDGGLSTANNPAMSLFLLATVPNYQYNWSVGKDNLSIYSFGTGRSDIGSLPSTWIKPLGWAQKAPNVLMQDISEQNDILLQILSQSNQRRYFDSVLEYLDNVKLTQEPLLNYYRFNVNIKKEYLNDELKYGFSKKEISALTEMDNPDSARLLFEIGEKASSQILEKYII